VRREPACRLPPPPLTSEGRLRWVSPKLSVSWLTPARRSLRATLGTLGEGSEVAGLGPVAWLGSARAWLAG